MSQKKMFEIKALIEAAEISLQQARELLSQIAGIEDKSLLKKAENQGTATRDEEQQIIEGVFDGQNMIGPDGKQYPVPANYASKSKLVEGDLLKLTIDNRGNFIYKQIGPIDRIKLRGTLSMDQKSDEWRVLADNKAYRILLASVTYFKGEAGDEVVIVVPKDKSSTWAAVENVIKNVETVAQSASGQTWQAPARQETTRTDIANQDIQKPKVDLLGSQIEPLELPEAASAPTDTANVTDALANDLDADEFEKI